MEAIPAPADDSSSANPSNASVKSDESSIAEGGRDSPPPNCAICLGRCRNKSFTDSCLHQFCFKCLVTWSRVKTECPLCKQNFKSIIHNVKSNHQYEEYPVEQRQEEDIERIVAATRRATLTMPRNDSLVFQQMLMQYPISAIMRQGMSLSTALEGTGILATRQRRRSSPNSFRRTVYRHNLWARPLPDFTGRFRECTPEFYRYNDSQVHRLIPWLNRELHYLLNENAGHIAYVLARIVELLPQQHIVSVEFRDSLHRYFRERTPHFTHELYVFASTPYDLTGYDRNVQYGSDTRLSTTVNEVPSGSESDGSVDSDIVMVSSSHAGEPRAGTSRAPTGTSRAPTGASRAPTGASRAPAGPSGASASAPPVYPLGAGYMPRADNNVIPIETISHSDTDDSSSEVMVVGYIKPPHQRTPEVVDLLGSDSDVLVQDAPAEPQPAPTRPTAATQTSQPAATTTAPTTTANLVRLTLTQQRPAVASDSDSDEAYTPPHPAPPLAVRRSRRTRPSATTSDTDHGTSTSSSSSRSTSSSSSSYSPQRRAPPAKRKRKTNSGDATSKRAQNKKNKKRLKRNSRAGAAGRGSRKRNSTRRPVEDSPGPSTSRTAPPSAHTTIRRRSPMRPYFASREATRLRYFMDSVPDLTPLRRAFYAEAGPDYTPLNLSGRAECDSGGEECDCCPAPK